MLPVASIPNSKWDGTSLTRPDAQVDASPTGDAYSRLISEFLALQDMSFLLFSNATPSGIITNTVDETDFDVTAELPTLKAGDVIKITARGITPATHSTDTLSVNLYVGDLLVATVAVTDVANGNEFQIDASLFVTASGMQGLVRQSTLAVPSAWTFSDVGVPDTAVNGKIIKATAIWSVADVGNTVILTQLVVELKRK